MGDVLGKYHPHGDIVGLRRARAHGAGLLAALSAGGRAGKLRLDRRRLRGGLPLHRGAADRARHGAAGGHREGNRRLQPELRRTGAKSPPCCRPRSPTCWSTELAASRSGMATNIPPHNLREIVDACVALIADREPLARTASRRSCAGPTSPPAATSADARASSEAFRTGRGRIVMRAKAIVEEDPEHRRREDRRHRDPLHGEQGAHAGADRRARAGQEDRRTSATCATSPTATACVS